MDMITRTVDREQVESVERQRLMVEPTGEVHPLADRWPMMDDEALDHLAADIRANGLQEPLVIDHEGRLVDGRNRLAGCLRAKVEPRYVSLNGISARAYIWSHNAQRRNTTAGQRAMIAVVDESYTEQGKLPRSKDELAREAGVDPKRIVEARLIMEWQPALAEDVIAGNVPMSVAYRKAQTAQQEKDSQGAQLQSLKAEDKNLAEEVTSGKKTLTEAQAELAQAKRERIDRITQTSRQLAAILNYLDPGSVPIEAAAQRWLLAEETGTVPADDFSLARLHRSRDVLSLYIARREEADASE